MAVLFESTATEITVTLVTIAVFVYWFFTRTFDYWEKHNVPYLKPELFFGNFRNRILMRKSLGEIWADHYWAMKGHKLGGTWFVTQPFLFIRDPEMIKRMLVKDFAHFQDRGMTVDEERNPLSAHLFNLGGSKWRALRTKLTPTFTSGKMKMMFTLMNECAHEFVQFVDEEFRKSDEIEFKEILAKFTTDVIGTCAFGLQFNSMKNPKSEFREMGRKVFAAGAFRTFQLITFQLLPALSRFLRIRSPPSDVSDFFINAVRETVDYREKNNVKRNDFLQLLIQLKNKGKVEEDQHDDKISAKDIPREHGDSNDVELTDNLLAAQAFVFFLAGFETSSTTMSFALHELANNPDVQEKLRNEIDNVLKETNGEFTYDGLKKMEYLENVINESLRKYPPLGALMRVCTKAYKEPETGAVVEEGVRVTIPVLALHHDPQYFPDPERFDPDRFTEAEKAKRPHYVYLPFGEGPRICIGMRFGMLQAKLGLAVLLARYELAPSARTPHPLKLNPRSFVTSSLGGIWVKLIPRKNLSSSTDL